LTEPLSPPIDLLDAAPGRGHPPAILARETGFALKLLSASDGAPMPPGQGQILVVLRGTAAYEEFGDENVVHTAQPDHRHDLPRGALFRVANDARWAIRGDDDTLVLALSTSVPREARRHEDVLTLAQRRPHMSPRLLFENEVARLEFSAARGRLPFRGWVPYDHTPEGAEYAIILAGQFEGRLKTADGGWWRGDLPEGSLLRVPAGVAHNFRARGRALNVGLIVSTRMHRQADGLVDRDAVKGSFSPFGR
jgi:mannose-6-phosphate isomerase-like protein (cupin superfamily)